jgi:hypothetical protein
MGDPLLGAMGHTVADVVRGADSVQGNDLPLAVIRLRHLVQARLVRPEPGRPWSLSIPHDQGVLTLQGEVGLRAAVRRDRGCADLTGSNVRFGPSPSIARRRPVQARERL